MNYETITRKGLDGWVAETSAQIGQEPTGKRMLKLTTARGRGGLCTSASISIHQPGGIRMFRIGGDDFHRPVVNAAPCNRVTENAVLQLHNRALLECPALIGEATAFYAQRETQPDER